MHLSPIVEQTLTRLCPIAAIFAGVGDVTAEHRIVRDFKKIITCKDPDSYLTTKPIIPPPQPSDE